MKIQLNDLLELFALLYRIIMLALRLRIHRTRANEDPGFGEESEYVR